jgi:hypothetical protein
LFLLREGEKNETCGMFNQWLTELLEDVHCTNSSVEFYLNSRGKELEASVPSSN